jgi:membrane carboxypeptidase/penicillin-binding protein
MGYPRGEIPMLDVHGQAVAGATFPVPIWHEYMAAALKHRPALGFALPKKYPSFQFLHKGDFGSLAYTPTTTVNITTPITGGAALGGGPH